MSKGPRFTRYGLALTVIGTTDYHTFHWQYKHSEALVYHLPTLGLYLHHVVRLHTYQFSQLSF
jgi:hypothetical protein